MNVSGFQPLEFVQCPACDSRVLVPDLVDQFRLEDFLGQGAMGRVYLAVDQNLNRKVAIKVLRKAFASTPSMWSQLEKEAKAAAGINHDRVVQVYRLGKIKSRPYIVMELVDEPNLQEIMKKAPLTESAACRIATDVMEGLEAARVTGLVHGDVKPANILVDEKGRAKIADFGLARFVTREQKVECWGTPYYMAPEKSRKKQEDFRSDLYSLGATLFHATAGRAPFEGKEGDEVIRLALKGPTPDLSQFRPEFSPRFCAGVYKMMRMNPDDRFQSYPEAISFMLGETFKKEKVVDTTVSRKSKWTTALKRFLVESPADEL
ncbi:MAG: serine/threonine protein kinase [Kiritimatiellae bacterium]|nr:serine/threonine protein kinase [Kiritimatiellia bacterium]